MFSRRSAIPTALAVVGYGRWGPNHVRTLASMHGVDLRLVCDASAEARARVEQSEFAGRVVENLGEICDDARIEGVVVATPAETHAQVATTLMRAGKHVLVEKPLASSLDQAQSIIQCAAEQRVVVHVGHICAHQAGVRRAAQLIRGGEIGDLRSLDAERSSVLPKNPKVDVLWDLAVHDLSILDLWTGCPPSRVMATGCRRSDGLIGAAMATLWYPGDVCATLRVSWMDHRKVRQVVAVGSRATLCFDDLDREDPLRQYSHKEQTSLSVDRTAPLLRELQAFVSAIRQGDSRTLAQQSGLHVVETLTALQRSVSLGGQVIARDSLAP